METCGGNCPNPEVKGDFHHFAEVVVGINRVNFVPVAPILMSLYEQLHFFRV